MSERKKQLFIDDLVIDEIIRKDKDIDETGQFKFTAERLEDVLNNGLAMAKEEDLTGKHFSHGAHILIEPLVNHKVVVTDAKVFNPYI